MGTPFYQCNVLLVLIFLNGTFSSSCISKLVTLNDCMCSGKQAIFECTIAGLGTTIWQGSAFNCTSSEIRFLHIADHFEGAFQMCNSGAIEGIGVSVTGNRCFVSQLNITLSQRLSGKSIQCVHNSGSSSSIVGNSNLSITSEPYTPPDNISIGEVARGSLTLVWNPLTVNCGSLVYHIHSFNCGECLRRITHPFASATCSNLILDGRVCTFSVQTEVCDNIYSETSTNISVTLLTPESPKLLVWPQYSNDSGNLKKIYTSFKKLVSFNISDGVDGSAVSYTVTYSDSITRRSCLSVTIPANSDTDSRGVCNHVFDVISSSCPSTTDIVVTLFATSALGDGPSSHSYTLESHNDRVGVILDLASSSVVCQFLQTQSNGDKFCNVSYGPSCDNLLYEGKNKSSLNNTIRINVDKFKNNLKEYCFIVFASNGTQFLSITGTFGIATGIENEPKTVTTIIATTLSFLGLSVTINLTLITTVVWLALRLKLSAKKNNNSGQNIIEMKANAVYGVRINTTSAVSQSDVINESESDASHPHTYESVTQIQT